jgi:serine phosphatase RsbU (regulator of sigma subunit)
MKESTKEPANRCGPDVLPSPGKATVPADRKVNVLVVDDQPANLLALEAILEGLDQNVVRAHSGPEALKRLLDDEFAAILLDVFMPGMDGFETAALIRQRDQSRHTPIIFLTAIGYDHTNLFKGYSVGAVDYLVKPIVPEILRSKVAVFADLFRKSEQVQRQAELLRALEHKEYERRLAEAHERYEAERLRQEARVARQIQQKLFPAAPLPLPGFDVGGASYPAEATGGDYFDYIPMLDGSLGIAVGDVCGHGMGPALIMAETRAYLRAFMLTRSDIAEIVALVNQALVHDVLDDRFTTLLLARLDPATHALTYTNAGHPPAYILDSSGHVKLSLKSTGMPLGIMPIVVFEAPPPIPLKPGDLILFLTDGILEARASDNTIFGTERTLDAVRAHRAQSAREIVAALYRTVCDFSRRRSQLDDMTAVVVKVAPE